MLEKPKRDNSYGVTNNSSHNYALLQEEILPDEQVYWVGQPDVSGLKWMSMNPVGFYHLREVDEVYRLLIELQAGRDVSWFGGGDNEKPKRKRDAA